MFVAKAHLYTFKINTILYEVQKQMGRGPKSYELLLNVLHVCYATRLQNLELSSGFTPFYIN